MPKPSRNPFQFEPSLFLVRHTRTDLAGLSMLALVESEVALEGAADKSEGAKLDSSLAVHAHAR